MPESANPDNKDLSGDLNEGTDEDTLGAIVVAAGSSTRMDGIDKIFADLGGIPVIAHSLRAFEASPAVKKVVLVVSQASVERSTALVRNMGYTKVVKVCAGGARRQDSVAAGLQLMDGVEWVMVHDGARPFVTPELLSRGLVAAQRRGAAIPGVPVKDTIKMARDGLVESNLDRSSLIAVQTPQVFKSAIIREAYARFSDDVTDDAGLVERLGHTVAVFEGSNTNIKITTPEDLAIARLFLRLQEGES